MLLPCVDDGGVRVVTSFRGICSDEMVMVPQMAESISEGTLKTWQKNVGDLVVTDTDVATDKVCI